MVCMRVGVWMSVGVGILEVGVYVGVYLSRWMDVGG